MPNKTEKNKTEKKCFIITPIGGKGTEVQREALGIVDVVIKPVAENCGFEQVKSAVDFHVGQITPNIIKAIYEADLVIANITGQNPNVMYELALSHAFKKPTIHILKENSSVPFDIKDYQYIDFINDISGTEALKEELHKKIEHVMFLDEGNISNPVIDALKTFTVIENENTNIKSDEMITELYRSVLDMRAEINALGSYFNRKSRNMSSKSMELRGMNGKETFLYDNFVRATNNKKYKDFRNIKDKDLYMFFNHALDSGMMVSSQSIEKFSNVIMMDKDLTIELVQELGIAVY
ncbi:hypothetical protein [Erysipelothrix tonsillarum]|uniref:hypothetical protein n=1 Tax=Erysipelothrix tonsillarum TaxID=38402 RepID=UPI00036B5CF6|nr:hypothetical protein [Erysipelothrix tonsillarum]